MNASSTPGIDRFVRPLALAGIVLAMASVHAQAPAGGGRGGRALSGGGLMLREHLGLRYTLEGFGSHAKAHATRSTIAS